MRPPVSTSNYAAGIADETKIISFDWWQELKTDNALLAFTPTQHFSSRSLSDRNITSSNAFCG